jgi:hypothetical protein
MRDDGSNVSTDSETPRTLKAENSVREAGRHSDFREEHAKKESRDKR